MSYALSIGSCDSYGDRVVLEGLDTLGGQISCQQSSSATSGSAFFPSGTGSVTVKIPYNFYYPARTDTLVVSGHYAGSIQSSASDSVSFLRAIGEVADWPLFWGLFGFAIVCGMLLRLAGRSVRQFSELFEDHD